MQFSQRVRIPLTPVSFFFLSFFFSCGSKPAPWVDLITERGESCFLNDFASAFTFCNDHCPFIRTRPCTRGLTAHACALTVHAVFVGCSRTRGLSPARGACGDQIHRALARLSHELIFLSVRHCTSAMARTLTQLLHACLRDCHDQG